MEIQSNHGHDVVESPLQGDVLELILSHVPLIDLVPAHRVSRSWSLAVSSSLVHFNRPRPWLVVHSQSTRPPYETVAHAFDPRSRDWVELQHQDPSSKRVPSGLCSQSGRLLYGLSPSQFSFSLDPLGLSWHQVDPPLVWRPDPIVAAVGRRVVVAGGGCDFDDDPFAVEIYDVETRKWESYNAMPSALRDCSASACLSVAAGRGQIYVAEKLSGVAHSFDPETKEWYGPYDLRPERNICCSVIGFANDRLILISLIGDPGSLSDSSLKGKTVKIWEVLGEFVEFREVTEMQPELLKELTGDEPSISSISVCSAGDMVYLYDPSKPGAVVWCEVAAEGGGCEWGTLRMAAMPEDGQNQPARKAVFTCWDVGIPELERALASDKLRLSVAKEGKQENAHNAD
ncbi:hypothetical protein CRG98_036945 [Punica granatum]|nr:hypothetical protein CRG98_036945 [Punica granatum]